MGVELGALSYSVGHTNQFNGRVVVGKYTSIAIGCVFLCGDCAMHASAGTQYVSNFRWQFVDRGDIAIGNDVWIGTNVIILAGVTPSSGRAVSFRKTCRPMPSSSVIRSGS
jgi:acetyltransferase-like isoleucine patch superfamily enzyme